MISWRRIATTSTKTDSASSYTFTAGGRFEVAFNREGRLTGVAQRTGLLEVAKP